MLLLVVALFSPTVVDRISNCVPVVEVNRTDKEYLDVVFHGHQFGIVDTRLLGKFLALFLHFHPDRGESKFGLSVEKSCLVAPLVYDAMLLSLDALFLACLATISEDRSMNV